jgi:hypothetical protein
MPLMLISKTERRRSYTVADLCLVRARVRAAGRREATQPALSATVTGVPKSRRQALRNVPPTVGRAEAHYQREGERMYGQTYEGAVL